MACFNSLLGNYQINPKFKYSYDFIVGKKCSYHCCLCDAKCKILTKKELKLCSIMEISDLCFISFSLHYEHATAFDGSIYNPDIDRFDRYYAKDFPVHDLDERQKCFVIMCIDNFLCKYTYKFF